MRASTRCKQYGITLVELMITIAILAIVAVVAVPSFQAVMANLEANRVQSTMRSVIQDSKYRAFTNRQRITICGSSNLQDCDAQWSNGFIIFNDLNINKTKDLAEEIIKKHSLNLKHGTLSWRGFGGSALFFQPDTGLPRGSNGSFYYCSSINLNYRIFLSNMGHSRIEKLISC
uniref:pilus assembly FimT family protein n=1 Tax=uncultured Acinetobacter sp. TaxID=165433 RepID=UPI00263055A2|nr:GspH/FimT family pseudopilin [uncultured Acinetobacter sp.]